MKPASGNIRTVLLVIVLLYITACSTVRCPISSSSAPPHGAYVKTELYFGLCKNEPCRIDEDFVSESEWQGFMDDYITPKFREGFTVIDAKGQWGMEPGKLIRERSKVVVIVHKDRGEADESIEYIRESYKRLFKQTSVLKVQTPAGVSF